MDPYGYILKQSVLSTSIVERCSDILDSVDFNEKMMSDEQVHENVFRAMDHPEQPIKQIQHVERFSEELRALSVILPPLFGYETDTYEVANMLVFIRHTGYKLLRPHQDGAYLGSDRFVTFWIPLNDVSPENSCLHYLLGSHRLGLLNHEETGTQTRNRTGAIGKSLDYMAFPLDQYTPLPMKMGDVVAHHPYTLHYSTVNQTDTIRRALTLIIKLKD